MTHTDQLNVLQGHANPSAPSSGVPTRIWQADVVAVNPDGTVDCQPVKGRSTKVSLAVPGTYQPTIGDRVLVTDLDGDPRTPAVLTPLSITPPTITGSRGGNAALTNLLTALAAAGLIVNHTTT